MDNSNNNKRALIILAIGSAVILLYSFAYVPFMDHWDSVQTELQLQQKKIDVIRSIYNPETDSVQQAINQKVPTFTMPATVDDQLLLFHQEVARQFKEAGFKPAAGPQYLSDKGSVHKSSGMRSFKLTCAGKTNFNQMIDLLLKLRENQYVKSIEELKITWDKNDRKNMDIDLTVSTLAR